MKNVHLNITGENINLMVNLKKTALQLCHCPQEPLLTKQPLKLCCHVSP